ncbi:thioredoxin domain-containing protein [Qipengyuania sp. MTN3-11]|uniref:thioredoxin domain-containing protein n=1 Tax=Qipengyuania sp. MTN3-11 TaxID=3056557 RepID=UPI0036F37608
MTSVPKIAAALAALALVATGGIAATQKQGATKKQNWLVAIARNDNGHRLGNPDAETKLVEYMSYTCSHCADFAREGEGAIKLAYIPTGKVSFEIRHLLRDPVDLTAALLTHCGEANRFMANHAAVILKQDEWLAAARATTQAQRSRWQFGSNAARRQAIASDLGFYEIMETRGYERTQLDRCLTDETKATALAETSMRDMRDHGIQGTPSFLVNGELLDGVHAWRALQPELDKRI